MKKGIAMLLIISLVCGYVGSTQVEATPKVNLKTYKNCTEINKVYPGGISRASNVKNVGGATKHKPFVNLKLYDLNKKSDRDKDFIACER
ncbi:excalibur calcium-binding domain-containing protein [Paenisporosarcina indica]|uniref:excalibur calcium-binding domain-containing protein n=1 Tax=Paenisporosarcina indica TaxID=650093 RepID=UPI00094F526C|nr:excalibur calcium-binding domain-containing protein [Paenisporosarcina indica]